MTTSEPPPAYEELFPNYPQLQDNVPDYFMDKFYRVPPPHSTYFVRRLEWSDGQGDYRGELDWKGRRAGEGTMVWSQGDSDNNERRVTRVYTGDWERDTMSGEGSMWWADTGTVYSGHWSWGVMHGQGHIQWGPGSHDPAQQYTGQFR